MVMASTEESQLPLQETNLNLMKTITDQESDDEDTLSLSDLPIGKDNDADSAVYANQVLSSEMTEDKFEFSNSNAQVKVRKPTLSSPKSVGNKRVISKQESPLQYPVLSKSSSKSSPGKRSVKKSEYWILQKSKSTTFNPSRSKKNTKGGIHQEYEEQKLSIFSSPLKSKWLFVLLGLPPKIPTDEAELKTDIRNRQSRHAPSTFFPANAHGCEELMAEDCPKTSEIKKRRTWISCYGGGPVHV